MNDLYKLKLARECERCTVLEDLLETANFKLAAALNEADKADDEAVSHKVEMLRLRASGSREDYVLIKRLEKQLVEAAKLLREVCDMQEAFEGERITTVRLEIKCRKIRAFLAKQGDA